MTPPEHTFGPSVHSALGEIGTAYTGAVIARDRYRSMLEDAQEFVERVGIDYDDTKALQLAADIKAELNPVPFKPCGLGICCMQDGHDGACES